MSRPNQKGYTLLETLIVMLIFGVIVIVVGNITVKGLRTYSYIQYQANAAADLSNLTGRVGKVVRGATSVTDAQTSSLTIFGYFSPQDAIVDKIRYFVSGSTLQVGVTPPSGTAPNYSYNASDEKITTLSTKLTGVNPVFTYYDAAGNALASGFAIGQIKQIGINLAVNPDPKKLPVDLTQQTRVTLRNQKTNL